MYENESYESHTPSESDWTRAERDLDAHLERQEARARRELAEGLLECREATGARATQMSGPVSDALNGWLKAMSANAWGYGAFTPAKPVASAQSVLSDESEAA